ncbi:MAG: prepilin peptidase [bacterium]|nr:prepilin peptidase [bacterium]
MWSIYAWVFIFGLSIGSFLNVLIYRLPLSLSVNGRSFCPKCKKKISWNDNIPLVSFVLLRGRCRHCHSPIGLQYPIVELLNGLLFLTVALFYQGGNYQLSLQSWNLSEQAIFNFQLGTLISLLFGWFLVSALIAVFVIDLKHEIIPDQIIFPSIFITFFVQVITSYPSILNVLLTALISFLFFLTLHLVTRGRGMGFGDVKLAFFIGLLLGFPKVLLAFYGAFLTGALLGAILILGRKRRFGQHIPFGPFLVFWTLVAFFWGETILKWITARFF